MKPEEMLSNLEEHYVTMPDGCQLYIADMEIEQLRELKREIDEYFVDSRDKLVDGWVVMDGELFDEARKYRQSQEIIRSHIALRYPDSNDFIILFNKYVNIRGNLAHHQRLTVGMKATIQEKDSELKLLGMHMNNANQRIRSLEGRLSHALGKSNLLEAKISALGDIRENYSVAMAFIRVLGLQDSFNKVKSMISFDSCADSIIISKVKCELNALRKSLSVDKVAQ